MQRVYVCVILMVDETNDKVLNLLLCVRNEGKPPRNLVANMTSVYIL